MLTELAVSDLGVIAELSLVFDAGMTVLTGETGAGKTLVVEAIDLLVGGRADPGLVRPGAREARVEGRFVVEGLPPSVVLPDEDVAMGDEIVLSRVVPAEGRSRAYVNGRPVTVGALGEWGRVLVDLHGQHAHQSLLDPLVQRQLLDSYGAIDVSPLRAAQADLRAVDVELEGLGGDERARAREIDLYRFQVDELAQAGLTNADEDITLAEEQLLLSDAEAHQQAAGEALVALSDDDGANDLLARARAALSDRAPYEQLDQRLGVITADLTDLKSDLRAISESIEHDPDRLEAVLARRRHLRELTRKYGETLADVIAYEADAKERLSELEGYEQRADQLDRHRGELVVELERAAAKVGAARRSAAPDLAEAAQVHLRELAMAGARLVVDVGDDPGDDVAVLLAANPGAPPLALTKVASGGELARTMLAIRRVVSEAPPTLIFDEVDAGIGGETASAVGGALAKLAGHHQVLVVTHLAQVAVFAGTHVAISKSDDGSSTVSVARALSDTERVVEISRMLSGSPDSDTAQHHAAELINSARERLGLGELEAPGH